MNQSVFLSHGTGSMKWVLADNGKVNNRLLRDYVISSVGALLKAEDMEAGYGREQYIIIQSMYMYILL